MLRKTFVAPAILAAHGKRSQPLCVDDGQGGFAVVPVRRAHARATAA